MIESLLVILIYIVVVGLVLWLLSYLVDHIPLDPPFKVVAKALIIGVGCIILIILLLRYLPALPASL